MTQFTWDPFKEIINVHKHGVDFATAAKAFQDPKKVIFHDAKHSIQEERLYCVGNVNGRIVTVRFTYRGDQIRIIGAGYWRKEKEYYEKENI